MSLARTVAPETLDALSADDPLAQRSRRDLARLHRLMGTGGILSRAMQMLWPSRRRTTPLEVLEIGAGDGTLMLGVARRLQPRWPRVNLTLLDRQRCVSRDTLDDFSNLGWTVKVIVTDVLDWAVQPPRALPWDLITANLLLHHFDDAPLALLLKAIAERGNRFLACEPRRDRLVLAASHLVGAVGANAVTRGDAVLSVHAGFRDQELSRHWPGMEAGWQSREYAAGLFSHAFTARRRGAST